MRIRPTRRPFGRTRVSVIVPTGSGSRDLAQAVEHRAPLFAGEIEPAQQRRLDAARLGGRDVGAVRVEDARLGGPEPLGRAQQPGVLAARVEVRDRARGFACVPGQGFDAFAQIHGAVSTVCRRAARGRRDG
jgi:hypothetical protein